MPISRSLESSGSTRPCPGHWGAPVSTCLCLSHQGWGSTRPCLGHQGALGPTCSCPGQYLHGAWGPHAHARFTGEPGVHTPISTSLESSGSTCLCLDHQGTPGATCPRPRSPDSLGSTCPCLYLWRASGSTCPRLGHRGARWRCHEAMKLGEGAEGFSRSPGDGMPTLDNGRQESELSMQHARQGALAPEDLKGLQLVLGGGGHWVS